MPSFFRKFRAEKAAKKPATTACSKHTSAHKGHWGACNADAAWDAEVLACDKEAGACGGSCGRGCGGGGCGGGGCGGGCGGGAAGAK